LNGAEDTLSCISTLALDEAIFALIQLKVAEDHPGRGFWDVYRENAYVIQPHLAELRALVDRLYSDPHIQVVGTEPGFMPRAMDDMEDYALLPRDALHLATMSHHGVDSMVTTDADFLPVDRLHIYTCNPTILSLA
jgi:predicted nucleic acid-binding protein